MAEKTHATAAAAAMALAVLCHAGTALADDPWEGFAPGDDTCDTNVELVHGARQVHDLQSFITILDVDWARIQQRNYRSYEVRVVSSPLRMAEIAAPARVDCAGNVLTAGVPYENAARDAVAIRWLSTGESDTFIRTTNPGILPAAAVYEIQMLETTYAVPRFNNSATQQTVLLLQNTRAQAVQGAIHFFAAAGTPVLSHPFTLPARGLLVVNTSTLPGLAGQSGSALVAQNGGYGALAGKAVALEPATGFTFDTPIEAKGY
jgi:hypothetical protein